MEPYRMLTVEASHRTGFGLQLAPAMLFSYLKTAQPGELMPYPGDEVELRLPGGEVHRAYISAFGIEAWQMGDSLVSNSDPKDPSLTLSLAGDLTPGDVPAGTEVWLLGRIGR